MRPRYDSYTPLSAPHAQILMEIEGEEYLRRPPPLNAKGLDQRSSIVDRSIYGSIIDKRIYASIVDRRTDGLDL